MVAQCGPVCIACAVTSSPGAKHIPPSGIANLVHTAVSSRQDKHIKLHSIELLLSLPGAAALDKGAFSDLLQAAVYSTEYRIAHLMCKLTPAAVPQQLDAATIESMLRIFILRHSQMRLQYEMQHEFEGIGDDKLAAPDFVDEEGVLRTNWYFLTFLCKLPSAAAVDAEAVVMVAFDSQELILLEHLCKKLVGLDESRVRNLIDKFMLEKQYEYLQSVLRAPAVQQLDLEYFGRVLFAAVADREGCTAYAPLKMPQATQMQSSTVLELWKLSGA